MTEADLSILSPALISVCTYSKTLLIQNSRDQKMFWIMKNLYN
jgi:hypothetical protein